MLPRHEVGQTFLVPGLVIREHFFTVPLDYNGSEATAGKVGTARPCHGRAGLQRLCVGRARGKAGRRVRQTPLRNADGLWHG